MKLEVKLLMIINIAFRLLVYKDFNIIYTDARLWVYITGFSYKLIL